MTGAAALALTAALLHVFNHSLFKSLLFFGAGAVLTSTGERDMERLGGLIHRMPRTALACLIGSAAIAALPPFNGFVSEWLTFQAILLSPALPQWLLKFLVRRGRAARPVGGARRRVLRQGVRHHLPRPTAHAGCGRGGGDRPLVARGDVGLAALCLLAGILPGYFIDALAPVIQSADRRSLPRQEQLDWLTIVPIAQSRSSYNGLLLFFFIGSRGLGAEVIHRWARRVRRSAAWDCGFPDRARRRSTRAASFSQPIRACSARRVPRARGGRPAAAGRCARRRMHVRLRDVRGTCCIAPSRSWSASPPTGSTGCNS
jgi:hypothetical protein